MSTITEKREVSTFSRLKFSGVGTVTLIPGDERGVEVTAPPALLRKVKTEVKNDTLVIGFKLAFLSWFRSLPELAGLEITVKTPGLVEIVSQGAGTLRTRGVLESDTLDLIVRGAGNVSLKAKSRELSCVMHGAAPVDLEAETKRLSATISGAGRMSASGSARYLDIRINGAGGFRGFELTSEEAVIDSRGAGQSQVSVSRKLDVRITGVGRVIYRGTPAVTESITGLGRLEADN
jgi:hypothetical protein